MAENTLAKSTEEEVMLDVEGGDIDIETETAPKSTKHASGQAFSNSITMFFTVMGCAVGTGNLWRFPRIVASEAGEGGGGAFLIQWLLFLFMWSIPLVIGEYAAGKYVRQSVAHTFGVLGGKWRVYVV